MRDERGSRTDQKVACSGTPTSILFVCTGNVFRSVAAEYAFRAQADKGIYQVASAGIAAAPQAVPSVIREHLLAKGIDPSSHVPRPLTREMLVSADLVVAMAEDHRQHLHCHFQSRAPLFQDIASGRQESVLDVHEALPTWQHHPDAAIAYARSVVEWLWNVMPLFLDRLPQFVPHDSRRRAEASR